MYASLVRLSFTVILFGCASSPAVSRPAKDAGSTGRLSVETKPPGAQVYVDGAEVGHTPLSVGVKVGSRLVVLQLDGQNFGPFFVDVQAGQTAVLRRRLLASIRNPAPRQTEKHTDLQHRIRRYLRTEGSHIFKKCMASRGGVAPPGSKTVTISYIQVEFRIDPGGKVLAVSRLHKDGRRRPAGKCIEKAASLLTFPAPGSELVHVWKLRVHTRVY